MDRHSHPEPRMPMIKQFSENGPVGVLKPCCTTVAGPTRALTARHPIKPTSPRCHSAWQPNPGRASTYRRGNSVQTTGTSSEFDVPLTAVTVVFTITLWMRLVGATAAGWMADRMGRKTPLMISILWYSLCNFIAGFSPTFAFLFFFRALLGIGMGAEWPARAALAMESWPARSRGFMSGVLQGSWGLGFALSALAYGFLFDLIGWRGLLWIGILPALVVVWIRFYVNEPAVWVENRRQQRETKTEVNAPLLSIFNPGLLFNTLTACFW